MRKRNTVVRFIIQVTGVLAIASVTLFAEGTETASPSCVFPGVFYNNTNQQMKMWADSAYYYVGPGQSSTRYNCDADSFGFVSVPFWAVRGSTSYYCNRGQWFGNNDNGGWGCWNAPYGVTIGWATYDCRPEPPNGFIVCRQQ